MSFYHDRQIRGYTIFLLAFSLLIFLMTFSVIINQNSFEEERAFYHDNAIASSLLEQGVPKDIIANALTNQTTTDTGKELLDMLNIAEKSKNFFSTNTYQLQPNIVCYVITMNMILIVFLFLGTFIFFQKRMQLYNQAEKVLNNYINNDYSCHLPQNNEGILFRLFTSIEQLATMLQAKNETEHKTKGFLKNTISDISHQLKTPLAALIMYQEIIENEPDNVETVKEFSKKMGTSLRRMEQLIQAMLKITRLDTGNIIFEKKSYQVSELIFNSLSELNTRAKAENKDIYINGNPNEKIFCDMDWTSEAVGNIVKNALDHTSPGAIINISWEHSPIMLRILISDNGNGIAPEDIHHIFKRFYRSKKSIDTPGVGLGLSLAKSIVDKQGGVISVQSSLNEGTTFVLSFLTEQ